MSDILLREGLNELNIQLVPIAPPGVEYGYYGIVPRTGKLTYSFNSRAELMAWFSTAKAKNYGDIGAGFLYLIAPKKIPFGQAFTVEYAAYLSYCPSNVCPLGAPVSWWIQIDDESDFFYQFPPEPYPPPAYPPPGSPIIREGGVSHAALPWGSKGIYCKITGYDKDYNPLHQTEGISIPIEITIPEIGEDTPPEDNNRYWVFYPSYIPQTVGSYEAYQKYVNALSQLGESAIIGCNAPKVIHYGEGMGLAVTLNIDSPYIPCGWFIEPLIDGKRTYAMTRFTSGDGFQRWLQIYIPPDYMGLTPEQAVGIKPFTPLSAGTHLLGLMLCDMYDCGAKYNIYKKVNMPFEIK